MTPPSLPERGGLFPVALGALVVLAIIIVGARYQANDMREEIALERRRRLEAEEDARTQRERVDGALATISEIKRARGDDDPE